MGFRCRWIAAKGANVEQLAVDLGFQVTQIWDEPVYDPGFYAVSLTSGWSLVFADGSDHMSEMSREQAMFVSNDGETLFFYTDDTPMCTELRCFRDGSPSWSIVYNGLGGVSSPDIEGMPPAALQEVVAAAESQQRQAGGRNAGVDYIYEITANLALALVGFRHDQTLMEDDARGILELHRAPDFHSD